MKIPSAIEQAKQLMKDHPESFKDCSLTQLLIGQAMEKYRQDCNAYIGEKQSVNVFDNPLQNGLTKFQKDVFEYGVGEQEELNWFEKYGGADNVVNARPR